MTFTPLVQSKNDSNNSISTTSTTFTGTGINVNGYNQISVHITSNQNSNNEGIEIQFSSDNSTWTTYIKETYYANTIFNKQYNIYNSYFRIKYLTTNATFTIETRLNTESTNTKPDDTNSNQMDAFGKLRVSNPYTLLDIKYSHESTATPEYLKNNMLICSKSTGAAIATYGSSTSILSSSGIGSYINQSRKYCIYQPGKSLLFLNSAIIQPTATSTNYNARLGYYDSNNGLFFEQNQNGLYVVLRNNASDTSILQSNWNIDTLNGNGTSGYNMDFSKAQIFVIDFGWLGVGKIRFGVYIFGKIVYCHQITNLNILTEPFMRTAFLPSRNELNVNDGGNASMTQICSSVISEGGYNPIGRPFNISNENIGISVNTTETPILALRGNLATASSSNNKYYHQQIIPTLINIYGSSNAEFLFKLRLYLAPNTPTVTTWTSVNNDSIAQYALGDSNITNISNTNIIISSSYVQGRENVSIQNLDDIFTKLIQITSNIDNECDVLLITAQALSGNANIYSSINWNESY